MSKSVNINGHTVLLADPTLPPPITHFVGRNEELRRCRAAWGIQDSNTALANGNVFRLHFRLEGPPGVGKNEIVYQIARELNTPIYTILGHEELTPEDLSLLLVPDPSRSSSSSVPLVLRASPLATAIYEGGIFFFDEINRVPERALAPLSSVLDNRLAIYSAMAGFSIEPKSDAAAKAFRFCCALNPNVTETGRGVLPDYIAERTLPVISVGYPTYEEIREIVKRNLQLAPVFLEAFDEWYHAKAREDISMRQALSLLKYAMNSRKQSKTEREAIDAAESMTFPTSTTSETAKTSTSRKKVVAQSSKQSPDR